MSLNDSLSEVERAKLAVWDYPVGDKYTKMWQAMLDAKMPANLEEAVERVRLSDGTSEGFAYLGDATDIRYLSITNCDLQMVGEEFSRKPYAIAVQQGSPLKDQFNNAILQLLNKRKLEKLKERWWSPTNPEIRKCDKQDDQQDGISIQNIGMLPHAAHPARNSLSKTCRKDVDVAKMAISPSLSRLFRHNCAAEIDILATSTSFRHPFDKSCLTGQCLHDVSKHRRQQQQS